MTVGPAESTDVVAVGQVIAGKFRVEGILGRGGMGIVAVAHHLHLNRRVAVKLLRPDVARRADATTRFLREAQALSGIQNEHVVRVLDVGRLENGAPFMVMEYLAGMDLGNLLDSRGPLPVRDVAEYLLQASEAIAEAHSRGIIHRDLKPGNMFLTHRPDGSPLVKILDFGISKVTGLLAPGEHELTATSDIMGSPAFISPEQLKSFKTVDPRTDIWALGVILHNLLSNRYPFEALTMPNLMAKILADPPTPLREHAPHAPPELEAAILRCLARDRDARMRSVLDFALALAPFAPPAAAALSLERIRGMSSADDLAIADMNSAEMRPREAMTSTPTVPLETLPLQRQKTAPLPNVAAFQSTELPTIPITAPAIAMASVASPKPPSPPAIRTVVLVALGVLVLLSLVLFLLPKGTATDMATTAASVPATQPSAPAPPILPSAQASADAPGPNVTASARVEATTPPAIPTSRRVGGRKPVSTAAPKSTSTVKGPVERQL